MHAVTCLAILPDVTQSNDMAAHMHHNATKSTWNWPYCMPNYNFNMTMIKSSGVARPLRHGGEFTCQWTSHFTDEIFWSISRLFLINIPSKHLFPCFTGGFSLHIFSPTNFPTLGAVAIPPPSRSLRLWLKAGHVSFPTSCICVCWPEKPLFAVVLWLCFAVLKPRAKFLTA